MLTVTLFLLFLLAALAGMFRRPRFALAVLIPALALFCLAGTGRLTAWLLAPLQRPYPTATQPHWGTRNAIVLLGAGAMTAPSGDCLPNVLAYSRIVEAVRLHHLGAASGHPCTLIISGGDPAGTGASEAAIYRTVALGLGVPDGEILLEPRSLNTFKNAEYCAPLLKAGGFDHVVLVTSAFHMRRSLLYFSYFGLDCEPAAAGPLGALPMWLPIGYNLAMADFAIHEYAGIQRFRLYNALGWNAKPSGQAGAA